MNHALLHKPLARPCMLLLGFGFAALLQSLHFYFYYEQSAGNSVFWSFADWVSWFLVMYLIHFSFGQLSNFNRRRFYWPVFGLVVLAAGPLQIVASNLITGLINPPSRTFLEDFLYLYDKRWLQNFLYAGLLWQGFNFLWPLMPGPVNGNAIKVWDGKVTHWLKPHDIHYVEAAGNYLCLYLGDREILIREPMKNFSDRLPGGVFIRISRSHLINKGKIARVEPYSRHSRQVVLQDGTELKIGRTFLADIKKAID